MRRFTSLRKFAIYVGVTLFLVGCGGGGYSILAESPDQLDNEAVGRQQLNYVKTQPLPYYDYSAQRDVVIQLYNATVPKLNDTWTIFFSALGEPIDSCASKGSPIPYGVQLSSPSYMKTSGNGGDSATSVELPQPEPSGLYVEGLSTEATWVLCVYNGGTEPVYAENNVQTYFHPVKVENGQIVHMEGAPSVTIDLSRAGG